MAPADLIAKYRGKYKAGWDRMRQERYQRQVAHGAHRREVAAESA